jgi:hypothetical protein
MFLNDALFMCFMECVSRNESLELYHVLQTLEWSWACGGSHASDPYCWKVNRFFFLQPVSLTQVLQFLCH